MDDLTLRLYLAAHDEWDLSAEIERLRDDVERLRRTVDAGSLAGLSGLAAREAGR